MIHNIITIMVGNLNFKDIMTKTKTNDFFVACKESRIESNTSFYGCFYLGPFDESLSQTLANDLRRTLLSELMGLAITSVEIEGVLHKFSSVPGMKESVLDLICNLQNIVLKKQKSNYYSTKKTYNGFLNVNGPRVIKAVDLKLPAGLQCVDPNQYIATLAENGMLNMKFTINEGKNFIKQKPHNLDVNVLKKRNILLQNLKISSLRDGRSPLLPPGAGQSSMVLSTLKKKTNSISIEKKRSALNRQQSKPSISQPIPLDAVFMPVTKINCIIEENNLYTDFSTDSVGTSTLNSSNLLAASNGSATIADSPMGVAHGRGRQSPLVLSTFAPATAPSGSNLRSFGSNLRYWQQQYRIRSSGSNGTRRAAIQNNYKLIPWNYNSLYFNLSDGTYNVSKIKTFLGTTPMVVTDYARYRNLSNASKPSAPQGSNSVLLLPVPKVATEGPNSVLLLPVPKVAPSGSSRRSNLRSFGTIHAGPPSGGTPRVYAKHSALRSVRSNLFRTFLPSYPMGIRPECNYSLPSKYINQNRNFRAIKTVLKESPGVSKILTAIGERLDCRREAPDNLGIIDRRLIRQVGKTYYPYNNNVHPLGPLRGGRPECIHPFLNQQTINLEYAKILKLKPLRKKSHLILEIWTNGSIHPRQALYLCFTFLSNNLLKLQTVKVIGSMFKSEIALGNIKNSYVNNYDYMIPKKAVASASAHYPLGWASPSGPSPEFIYPSSKKTKDSVPSKNINSISAVSKISDIRQIGKAPNVLDLRSKTYVTTNESNILQSSLKAPIGILKISLRAYTALKKAGIFTIQDVLNKSKTDLLQIKQFGTKYLDEIETSLADLGLTLKQ